MNKERAFSPSLLYKAAIIFVCTSIVGLFVHEFGHGFTAVALGGKVEALYVIPGFEIYPHFGGWYEGNFGPDIGYITWTPASYWGAWENPTVRLAGCALTFLISIISVVGLWVVKPAGWLSDVMSGGSIMFVDGFLYTILPECFGWRHFFCLGGETAEFLDAAVALGASRGPVFLAVVLGSLAIGLALALYQYRLWQHRTDYVD